LYNTCKPKVTVFWIFKILGQYKKSLFLFSECSKKRSQNI